MNVQGRARAVHGVTFVTVRVVNPTTEPAAFRLDSTLDGPVWPPRRHGRPDRGWDTNGYEGHLRGGESLSLGFATPAPPAADPVALVWTDSTVADGTEADQAPDARSAIRRYRDPRPPRSVLSPPRICGDGDDSIAGASTGGRP